MANVGTPTPEGNWGPDLVTATQNAIRKLLSRNNAKCELRAAKIAALQIAQDLQTEQNKECHMYKGRDYQWD